MPRVDAAGTSSAPCSTISGTSGSRPLPEEAAAHAKVYRTDGLVAPEGENSERSGASPPILSVSRSANDRATSEMSDENRSVRQAARPRLPARASANEKDR